MAAKRLMAPIQFSRLLTPAIVRDHPKLSLASLHR
jgi:hypothetical protein